MSDTKPIAGKPRGAIPLAPEGWPFIITLAVGAGLSVLARKGAQAGADA